MFRRVADIVITPTGVPGVVRVTLSWAEGRVPAMWTVDVPVDRALDMIRTFQPDAVHILRRPVRKPEAQP